MPCKMLEIMRLLSTLTSSSAMRFPTIIALQQMAEDPKEVKSINKRELVNSAATKHCVCQHVAKRVRLIRVIKLK